MKCDGRPDDAADLQSLSMGSHANQLRIFFIIRKIFFQPCEAGIVHVAENASQCPLCSKEEIPDNVLDKHVFQQVRLKRIRALHVLQGLREHGKGVSFQSVPAHIVVGFRRGPVGPSVADIRRDVDFCATAHVDYVEIEILADPGLHEAEFVLLNELSSVYSPPGG